MPEARGFEWSYTDQICSRGERSQLCSGLHACNSGDRQSMIVPIQISRSYAYSKAMQTTTLRELEQSSTPLEGAEMWLYNM